MTSENVDKTMATKICLVRGVGRHKEKLFSFEMALRDANIAEYNLVRVSSIFPPNAKLVKIPKMKENLRPGEIVHCVMSDNATNEANRLVVSSVGLAMPVDSTNHGYLCLSGDTLIEMPGKKEKIKDLIKEKDFYVYSYDNELGRIVLSKVKNVFLVKKDANVLKMTLDNNKTVVATPDHKFMMRDGSYKQLKDIKIFDSLMPFYRVDNEFLKDSYIVLNNGKKRIEYRFILEEILGRKLNTNEICHHIDGNHNNNVPDNLMVLSSAEHTLLHHNNRSKELEDIRRNKISKRAIGRAFSEERKKQYSVLFTGKNNPMYGKSATKGKKYDKEHNEKVSRYVQKYWDELRKDPIKFQERIKNYNGSKNASDLTRKKMSFSAKKRAESSLRDKKGRFIKKDSFYNHKVIAIEIASSEDVYCMEVENTHNFALECGIISSNSESHSFGQTDSESGDYAEDLAFSLLATILDIPFDEDKSWDEKKGIWKLNKHIIKTKNITQSALGKRGLWTTVVSAAILIP